MIEDNGLFLRKASGLTRSASTFDVFIFNTGLISVGLAVAFNAYYLPAFYPSANVAVACLLATALMLFGGAGFYLWSILLPRSGGNYVFVSRTFHPAVGFVISWMEVCVLLFYTAVAAALFVRIGVTTLLGGVGTVIGSTVLVRSSEVLGQPWPTFFGGSIVIVISSLLLSSGMRRFLRVQRVMFTLALLGTLSLAIVLYNTDPAIVTSRLHESFVGFDVDHLVEAVSAKGWRESTPTLLGSVAAVGWPLLPLAGGVLSIGIGAEVQRVKRSQFIGILGSILLSGLVFALLGQMAEAHIGRQVLGAISFANSQGLEFGAPTSVPWLPFLAVGLSGSPLAALLIGIGFVAWIYLWIPGMLAYCNRSFLAWSLDRVAPAWLGEVHPRWQTLVNGSALGGFIAILLLAAYIWIPPLQGLVIFQMLIFAWAVSLFAGALFPYVRPRLFEAATGGGAVVPHKKVFSGVMILGAIAFLVGGVILWNDPVAAGHSPLAISILAGILALGVALYVAAFLVRKRSGIDISRAFREIPIE